MAKETLKLVPKQPNQVFYLECTERKSGEIDKLREFFNRRLTQYDETPGKTADILLSELFIHQKRRLRKNLHGIRILADGFSDGLHSDLNNLMHTLDIDVVSRIMGVTRGQYSAELKANFDLEATAEAAEEQLKAMPEIKSSTAHTGNVLTSTASIMASGNPGTIAAVYRVMGQNFENLERDQNRFYYTHALSFSK